MRAREHHSCTLQDEAHQPRVTRAEHIKTPAVQMRNARQSHATCDDKQPSLANECTPIGYVKHANPRHPPPDADPKDLKESPRREHCTPRIMFAPRGQDSTNGSFGIPPLEEFVDELGHPPRLLTHESEVHYLHSTCALGNSHDRSRCVRRTNSGARPKTHSGRH